MQRGWGSEFSSPKTSPPHSRTPLLMEIAGIAAPQASIIGFLLPILRFNSLSTGKCTPPYFFGSSLMCFSALVVQFLPISWDNACLNLRLFVWIRGLCGMASGLMWVLKWLGTSHCPHPLFSSYLRCTHQVLGEMPQWHLGMILWTLVCGTDLGIWIACRG